MYKVGDKVRVRTDLEVGKNGTLIMMKASEGKEFTVSGVQDWGFFRTYDLDGDEYGFIWKECLLEPVESKTEVEEKYINDLMVKIETLEKEIKVLKEPLLPCPFCGGKAIWWETDDENYPYQIICQDCNCGTDECGDRQDAIDYWNRRV